MKLLLPAVLSAAMLGCTSFGGDRIIRVTGNMPHSTSQPPATQCQLGMVSISSGKVGTRSVTTGFSTTMMVVVGSTPAPYYFVADCDDGRRFRSGEVVVGGRGGHGNTFNLGTLVESH